MRIADWIQSAIWCCWVEKRIKFCYRVSKIKSDVLVSTCQRRWSVIFFENWVGGVSRRAAHVLRCSSGVGRRPGPEAPRFGCWVLSLGPRTLWHFYTDPLRLFRQPFVMAINAFMARLCTTADQSAWMTPAGLGVKSLVLCWIFRLCMSSQMVLSAYGSLCSPSGYSRNPH